jgi:hypothetical protein
MMWILSSINKGVSQRMENTMLSALSNCSSAKEAGHISRQMTNFAYHHYLRNATRQQITHETESFFADDFLLTPFLAVRLEVCSNNAIYIKCFLKAKIK